MGSNHSTNKKQSRGKSVSKSKSRYNKNYYFIYEDRNTNMGSNHNTNKKQSRGKSVSKSKSSAKTPQKNKNNKIFTFVKQNKIIVGIVLAAATLALVLFLIFGTGLSKKKADEIVHSDWDKMVSSYGHDNNDSLYDELPDYIELASEPQESDAAQKPEFVILIEQKTSFRLVDMKKSDGSYILTYSVTAPDVKSQLSSYIMEHGEEEINLAGMNQLLIEFVNQSESKTIEAEVVIYRENNEYKVSYSDKFFDAMYGGIYSFSLEAIANTDKKTDEDKKEANQ